MAGSADDQSSALSAAQAEAFEVLSAHFGQSLTPLSKSAVKSIGDGVGWSLPLPEDHWGSERCLWILLASSFPRVSPLVLVTPSAYGDWPHVTREGALCMWQDGMAPVGKSPKQQIREVLERVASILSVIYPEPDHTQIAAEFSREWLSYWVPRKGSISNASALILALPPPIAATLATRIISLSDRRRIVLVGGNTEIQRSWAAAFRNGAVDSSTLETIYVPLNGPLVGAPNSIDALMSLIRIEAPGADAMLAARLTASDGPLLVVFGVAGDGYSFAALELTPIPDMRPQARPPYNAKEARNRNGRRKTDHRRVKILPIGRADPEWIHGRGFDLEARQLANTRVWVIGCGSLGGLVVRGLASAGVGRLTLVDDDCLEAPNLGRHVLGVRDLNRNKAVALADLLRSQLPHLHVDAMMAKYPVVKPPVGAEGPDLIISTTADWPADLQLMDAVARGDHSWVQLTWAEPHAVAGHSLLLNPDSNARSLFSDEGRFLREVTTWPLTSRVLPGCSGTHQPGTFNRLQRVASLAVEQSIAHILGRRREAEHLACLGDDLTLQRLGGTWRNSAAAPQGIRERTLSLPIPSNLA